MLGGHFTSSCPTSLLYSSKDSHNLATIPGNLATYSESLEKVANFASESLANFRRNRWPTSIGISGQLAPENATSHGGIMDLMVMEVFMSGQTALKFETEVTVNGQIEVTVPFPAGAQVTVFVKEAGDSFSDLLHASESSLAFWDNPTDDQDWNNA